MEIERQHYELAYQLARKIRQGKMRLTSRDELKGMILLSR
jgi:hypothetical protein